VKLTVYLETSVLSYLAAAPSRDLLTAAHQHVTDLWWRTRRSSFELFVSQLVIDESAAGTLRRLGDALPSWSIYPSWTLTTRQLNWHGISP